MQAIDAILRGGAVAETRALGPIQFDQIKVNYFDRRPRAQAAIVPASDRNAQIEVESGFTPAGAFDESHRCFSCGEFGLRKLLAAVPRQLDIEAQELRSLQRYADRAHMDARSDSLRWSAEP